MTPKEFNAVNNLQYKKISVITLINKKKEKN